jgi:hypothetical protein
LSFDSAVRRRLFPVAFTTVLIALVGATGASSEVFEVPVDYPTIQEAVDVAAEGDTVLVAPGTYDRSWNRILSKPSGNIAIVTNVHVETPIVLASQAGAQATVILGSGRGPVLVVSNARGVIVDGFTIKGGAVDETIMDGGGGIYCELSDMEVRDCVIEENSAPFGAGIACFTASGSWIHDNIIRNNSDCEFGGGLVLLGGSNGTIESNLISGNVANIFGGAMLIGEQSSATVESNTIVKNQATSGSGLFCRDGAEVNASLNIFALGTGVGAVYCDTLAQGRPCIMSLSCNDFWENAGDETKGCVAGTGNRNTNPFFCSPETGDFTLCVFSPSLGTIDACGRRGTLPIGCYDCPAEGRYLSWGALKALYSQVSSKSK